MTQMPVNQNIFYKKIFVILLLVIAGSVFYWFLLRKGFIFPLTELSEMVCVNNCVAQQQLHVPPSGSELLNDHKSLKNLITLAPDKQKSSLLIEKSKHRLTFYYDGKAVKSYPVVFGGNPKGDKFQEGDLKTPEGIFRIRDFYPHPTWSNVNRALQRNRF